MKYKGILFIFLLVIITGMITTTCDDNQSTIAGSSYAIGDFVPQDTTWKTLTLREKIGQTMIVVSRFYEHNQWEGGNLDTFFNRYPVGGFFMADWYYRYNTPQDSSIDYYMKESIKEYAASSGYPLIFMEDYERGLGLQFENYTHMPVEMAMGAANSKELAYRYGKSIAKEARDFGINYLLHPVIDLSINPLHSLLNERGISDDPKRALPLLRKQIEGMHSEHIITTIKHFPGDGTTMRDQHLMTATNNMSMDEWEQTFGKMFRTLIEDGAGSVMVGHLTFPAYQKETYKGDLLPATLSSELIEGLLKGELGFKGVVISDALNMGGAIGYYEGELETSIKCFDAGVDLMLWPDLAFMDSVEARILRGEIPMKRLDDAVQRIWAMKERYGLLDKNYRIFKKLTKEDREFVRETAREVAEKGVTLCRGEEGSLPLDTSKVKKILLVNVSEVDKSHLFDYSKEILEERGYVVDIRYGLSYFNWNWRMDSLKYYDRIIACFENKYFDPVGITFFKGIEAETVWTFNMLPKEQMIAVSYSNPYYLEYYFQHIPVLINAYGSDIYMQEAVVKLLTGEIEATATSPVSFDKKVLK